MAILNITYNGLSADYPREIEDRVTDADVRRIAVEIVRTGGLRGLHIASLPDNAFDYYVVDRLDGRRGALRIYLRPKVPFGGGARRCLGAAMATYEMRIVVATILRSVDLRLASLRPDPGKIRATNAGPAYGVKVVVEARR